MANSGDESLRRACELAATAAISLARELKPPALCCGQEPRVLTTHGQTLILCTACARTVGGPVGTVAGAWGVLMSQYLPIANENPQQCPDCGEGEVLQLLEDLHACTVCRKTWSGAELEKTLDRPANRMEDAQILQCWREQTKRKPGTGGGGNPGGRKKEKKAGDRPKPWDIGEKQKVDLLRGARNNVLSLPGLQEDTELIRQAIAAKWLGET